MGGSKRQKGSGPPPTSFPVYQSAEPENRTPDLRNELRNEMDECNSLDYYTIWSRSVEAVISNMARLRTGLAGLGGLGGVRHVLWCAVVWVLCGRCRRRCRCRCRCQLRGRDGRCRRGECRRHGIWNKVCLDSWTPVFVSAEIDWPSWRLVVYPCRFLWGGITSTDVTFHCLCWKR